MILKACFQVKSEVLFFDSLPAAGARMGISQSDRLQAFRICNPQEANLALAGARMGVSQSDRLQAFLISIQQTSPLLAGISIYLA
jgi:hypothetical protein